MDWRSYLIFVTLNFLIYQCKWSKYNEIFGTILFSLSCSVLIVLYCCDCSALFLVVPFGCDCFVLSGPFYFAWLALYYCKFCIVAIVLLYWLFQSVLLVLNYCNCSTLISLVPFCFACSALSFGSQMQNSIKNLKQWHNRRNEKKIEKY